MFIYKYVKEIFIDCTLSTVHCVRHPERVEFDAADVLGGIKNIQGEEQLIRVNKNN